MSIADVLCKDCLNIGQCVACFKTVHNPNLTNNNNINNKKGNVKKDHVAIKLRNDFNLSIVAESMNK